VSEAAPPGIARFDSAAGMARALGHFLHGREFTSLTGSAALDTLIRRINLLPRRPREWFYSVSGAIEALPQRRVPRLDLDRIAAWLAGLYPDRRYASAFIGSSNGALIHLAAALGAPWLPQTFLCPVRQFGVDPDEPRAGFATGRPIVEMLLRAHPDIAVHHMHDPNQDRLMLRTMSYYRLKYRRLPPAYRDALERWLPPGATLYVVDCTKRWPVLRTGARSLFQFGALGGMEADEYFRGSPRLRAALARTGTGRARWDPPEPDDEAPEAEWGFDPALRGELVEMAHDRGWRLVEIRFSEPEALSGIAARLYQSWYREAGYDGPLRLLADSFVLMMPLRTQRLRAVPYWLLFAVAASAARLARFLDAQPRFEEVDLFLFSHGTEGVGVAPIAAWQALAARGRRPGRLLGVDPARYPRDFATFARFAGDAATLAPVHPPLAALPPARFEALLREHAPEGVEIVARRPAVAAG
jgi:hypothetical protein